MFTNIILIIDKWKEKNDQKMHCATQEVSEFRK